MVLMVVGIVVDGVVVAESDDSLDFSDDSYDGGDGYGDDCGVIMVVAGCGFIDHGGGDFDGDSDVRSVGNDGGGGIDYGAVNSGSNQCDDNGGDGRYCGADDNGCDVDGDRGVAGG